MRVEASAHALMRIGLGLAAVGRPGYINLGHGADLGDERSIEDLECRTHALLDSGYEAGVRYFDTARSYGRAEAFLAGWLDARGLGRSDVTVGSKWGYTYTAGWQVDADPPEVKDLSVDTFRRQLEETRALLGDRLALYQVHSATLSSGVLDDERLASELAALRSDGVAVGLTVTGEEQAATIDRAVETGRFDAVQATFNPLEQAAGAGLERAHAAGMRVIVKEALANGRLTARGGLEPLERSARRLGTTPDALALAWVLARPWVDIALSGAATGEQLASNLLALEAELDAQAEEELAGLAEPSERYWATRSGLAWT